jgi:hypothetical protein
MASAFAGAAYDAGDIMGGLYGEGIIACPRAFPPALADRPHVEIMALFAEAQTVAGGALPRGPHPWYVETQPERLSGFAQIAAHPWFVAVCEAVLGPDYRIIEVGFDIPIPGAADEPWHRDFAVPEATTKGRRLNSLAFNLTRSTPAPHTAPSRSRRSPSGTSSRAAPAGIFPAPDLWPRYDARAVQKLPKRGEMSARSALTVHRKTAALQLRLGANRPAPCLRQSGRDPRLPRPSPPRRHSRARSHGQAAPRLCRAPERCPGPDRRGLGGGHKRSKPVETALRDAERRVNRLYAQML